MLFGIMRYGVYSINYNIIFTLGAVPNHTLRD
jgi:hypothetical protein